MKLHAVIALSLLAWGCDDGDETSPDAQPAREDVQIFQPGQDAGGGGTGGGGGEGRLHHLMSYVKTVSPRGGGASRTDLFVYDFEDEEEFDLTSELEGEIDCTSRVCRVKADLTWIGWLAPQGGGGYALLVAPIDLARRRVDIDAKRSVSEDVLDFQFTPDNIVYKRGTAAGAEAALEVISEPIGGFNAAGCASGAVPAEQCQQIIGAINASGDFRVSRDNNLVILIQATLSKMDLSFFNTSTGTAQKFVQFGEDEGTGSQFNGQLPMSLSPDSSYMAVFTRDEFLWKINVVEARPGAPAPVVMDLFETSSHPDGDCQRDMPFNFNEVLFNPFFGSSSDHFYFLAHGDCSRQDNPNFNRDDYDVFKVSKDLSSPPVNISNNLRASHWSNHQMIEFTVSSDGNQLAFISARPNNNLSQSIWIMNTSDGSYNCDRQGNPQPSLDSITRCEFIFDDTQNQDTQFRSPQFHEVMVSK
ncbi:hypothetical protein KKF91_16180 [Myxococcota bacterium]|nr:hypothetical protein [Myxococcota bacterium]MBU1432079.1 hypothetical protein [Myxococcota bacterium]MBU1897779.1 hypothetical protein [Myxococcota bacterium]